jgi:hypothetical protein
MRDSDRWRYTGEVEVKIQKFLTAFWKLCAQAT